MKITKEIREYVKHAVSAEVSKTKNKILKELNDNYPKIEKKYHDAFIEETAPIIEKYKKLVETEHPEFAVQPGVTWCFTRRYDNTFSVSDDIISSNILVQLSLIKKIESITDIDNLINAEIEKYFKIKGDNN